MKRIEFYPLGSVVRLKKSVRDVMIVSRAMILPINEEQKFFDYGACSYPEGVMDGQLFYFNHEDIDKLQFEGYRNELDEIMVQNLQQSMEAAEIEHGDTLKIHDQIMQSQQANA